jgi:Zn finger protein HypA/HybF involved in hydrogenase expression
MHELDITRHLIKETKKALTNNPNYNNIMVYIEVGNLSTYSIMPIKFYFKNLLKEDEYFNDKNIKLIIKEKKGILYCNDCKNKIKISNLSDLYCNKCFSQNTDIIEGKEVIIKKIELL